MPSAAYTQNLFDANYQVLYGNPFYPQTSINFEKDWNCLIRMVYRTGGNDKNARHLIDAISDDLDKIDMFFDKYFYGPFATLCVSIIEKLRRCNRLSMQRELTFSVELRREFCLRHNFFRACASP